MDSEPRVPPSLRSRISRRRLLGLGAVVGLGAAGLGLAACASPAAPSPTQPAPAGQQKPSAQQPSPAAQAAKIELDYWHPETREAAVNEDKKWIAAFERANPGVTVKYTVIPWGDLNTKIRTAHATNTLPDIVYTYATSHAGWGYEGVTQPIDDLIKSIGEDRFDEAYLKYAKVDGHAYAVPWFGFNHVLFYRGDWYQEANLKPIDTWDSWLNNVKALHKPPDRYGILLYNANQAEVKYIVSLIALNGGSILNEQNEPSTNTPEVIEALRFYKQLAQYSPPGWQDKGETEQRLAMLKGAGAHMESSTSFADNIRTQMKEQPGIEKQVVAVKLPINKGNRQGWVAFSGFGVTRSTKHRDLVTALIGSYFTKERYLEYVQNTVTGWTPVLKDAQTEDYFNHPNIKPFESIIRAGIEVGKTGVMESQTYGPNKVANLIQGANILKEAVDLLTLQDQTPEQVAEWMDKRIREVAKDAG
ncbi:MAG TPA: extracellular solute-binding protein [Chloroflexota bacterium]